VAVADLAHEEAEECGREHGVDAADRLQVAPPGRRQVGLGELRPDRLPPPRRLSLREPRHRAPYPPVAQQKGEIN
jgi:hypothetical protein